MKKLSPTKMIVPSHRHDGQLLKRLAGGDLDALAELYDAYAPVLLRLAQRLGSEQEAEDVVQTVFIRLPQLAAKFDPKERSARPWLFAIAVHVAQEHRRRLRRLAATARAVALAQLGAPRVVPEPGRRRDLEHCLRALPMGKRAVVVLSDIEGFSCEEVAAMLEIPVGTVWTRLHYARRMLRASLSEEP